MRGWLNRQREWLTVTVIYLFLSLALTYPLVTKLTSHVPGRNVDDGIFVWNLWWVKYAITELHTNPFYTNHIFYPLGASLVFYTLTIINGLIALPLQWMVSSITANNLIYLFSLTLSGTGAFLLAKDLLQFEVGEKDETGGDWDGSLSRSRLIRIAAFVAGVIFAFPASRFVYASFGQQNLTSSEWIPFFALFLLRAIREKATGPTGLAAYGRPKFRSRLGGNKSAILAGVFLALAIYTEMTYAVFLLIFALIVVLCRAPFRQRRRLVNVAVQLMIMAFTCVIGLLPLLFFAWQETRLGEGGYLSSGWGYADAFSADLFTFFIPTSLHPVLGAAAGNLTATFTDVNIVFLGYFTLGLALAGALLFRRRLRAWIWGAITFAILCLGPILHINGKADFDFDGLVANVPLPFLLLHYLPIIKANRTPNRFSIMLMLCLAILAAFGLYGLLARLARGGALKRLGSIVGVVILGGVLFDHLSIPLPLNDMRAPAVYDLIAQEPDDFAILQLPLGWRNSYGVMGHERTVIQSYQAVHHKRMLAGNLSRNPDFKFGYFSQIPVLKTIIAMEQDGQLEQHPSQVDLTIAQQIVQLYDLRYLVVHRDYIDPRVEDYAVRVFGLEKVAADGSTIAYRIPGAEMPSKTIIDFGLPESWMYRGEGWSGDETLGGVTANWAERSEVRLFFPAYGRKDLVAVLRLTPFVYNGMPEQQVKVEVNGKPVTNLNLKAEWSEYAVAVAGNLQRNGPNAIRLHFAHLASPSQVLPGDFRLGGTGVDSPVSIGVQSAGMTSGNAVRIEVGGRSVARDGRGYNLVVIDPTAGKVEKSDVFDTFASEKEADRLARFIAEVSAGRIVIGGVKDDASRDLTANAVDALKSLGLGSDLRGRFRWSQAFIGVKGALPGQALEQLDEGSVSLSVGLNPDTRYLAAALDSLEIESK